MSNLSRDFAKFKKLGSEVSEALCKIYLYSLKFHLLDHLREEVS